MLQIIYWSILVITLFILTLIIVPVERFRQLLSYGLIGGIGLALVIFPFARMLNLWRTIGGIDILNLLPLLPTIAWFFPTVIFGCYFPRKNSVLARGGFILLFALGAVVVQSILVYLGMWRSYNWNLFYTFLLAFTTHSILAIYIMRTEQYLK